MSWRGFKKAVTRLPQQVLQKAGYAEETFDEEFEAIDGEFKDLEHSAKILADDSKAYVTAVSNLLLAQVAVGQMFQQTFNLSEEEPVSSYGEAVEAYISSSTTWLETMKPYLEQTLQSIVVDPATGLLVITKQVRALVEKRGRKLLDFDRTKNALKKAREKLDTTSTDVSKVTKAENEFQDDKRDYEGLNEKLKQEIPILLHHRIEFMNPMIEALISFQIYFFEQGAASLQPLSKFIDFALPTKETYEEKRTPALELLTALTLVNPIRIDPNAAPRSVYAEPAATGEKANPPSYHESTSPTIPAPSTSAAAAAAAPPVPHAAPRHTSDVVAHAVALFPFQSDTEGDLSFQKDEKIQIIQKSDNQEDWWVGRIGQRQGYFPANYVRII